MKKKLINEEIRRMQILAGIVKEDTELTEISWRELESEPVKETLEKLGYEGKWSPLIKGWAYAKKLDNGILRIEINSPSFNPTDFRFNATFWPNEGPKPTSRHEVEWLKGRHTQTVEIRDLKNQEEFLELIKKKVEEAEQKAKNGEINIMKKDAKTK